MRTPASKLKLGASLAIKAPAEIDRLPYTPAFEMLFEEWKTNPHGSNDRNECWWCMNSARKRGMVKKYRQHDPGTN